ncbi:MAG: nuclease-related domain-containing protein [Candidatus Woesearchaeota archaeon]
MILYKIEPIISKIITSFKELTLERKITLYIAICIFCYYIFRILQSKYKIVQFGKKGERRVRKILRKFKGKVYILNDVLLPLYNNYTQIDHVVIGDFGIIVIETKNFGGFVYGQKDSNNWIQKQGNYKKPFYNPIKQNETHIKTIKYWLNKNKYSVSNIKNLVYFAGNATIKCNCDLVLNSPDKLKKYVKSQIKSSKKKINRKMKKEIYKCLKELNVTSFSAKRKHIKRINFYKNK